MVLTLGFAQRSAAGIILVTTVDDKISATGGCSLQEAIYSANFDNNIAIDSVNSDGTDHFITTQCTPGSGDDTIVLAVGGVFQMSSIVDDAHNPFGPTATPIIFSNITIIGYGSRLQWVGTQNARAFAVGTASVQLPGGGSASGTGNLTLTEVWIKGFHAKGGDSAWGGGGGLGAGGAIYVQAGALDVEDSTFDTNGATGGTSTGGGAGGGGGLGGNGGVASETIGGGGGGGARGNGGASAFDGGGGGGGGTVFAGADDVARPGGAGGQLCGGNGGDASDDGSNGNDAPCPGGGGGGTGLAINPIDPLSTNNGGNGNYGGGGGGSPDNGGNGGFGGGGGSSSPCCSGSQGGNGGFGGGGGIGGPGFISGAPGQGGAFGGNAGINGGGGGGALGGAIFNDSGSVVVRNSTFTNNYVTRGLGQNAGPVGGSGANGSDAGGAIFVVDGQLTVVDSTISGNESTGFGGGIVLFQTFGIPPPSASFYLDDTIISNNGLNECVIAGFSIDANGAGNLILNNDNCLGVVTTADPEVGVLEDNGGFTPTMAISTASPAWNTADTSSSLGVDQRGQVRPAMNNLFDIGAFELCEKIERLLITPCPPTKFGVVDTEPLTMQVSPLAGGNTTPPPGVNTEPLGSVVALTATPSAGHIFQNWSGDVADANNPFTTVTIDAPQTVTANFVQSVACVNNLYGRGTPSGLAAARIDLTWTAIPNAVSYNVLRGVTSGGPYLLIGNATLTSYSDRSGLTNGNTYYYILQPVGGGMVGELCQSNQATITIPQKH